ncbi:hypothetical protein TYRP_004134 [Tyrophagus putrescentiae]|nr:hypothetical protein TYRP_004134 [Tyrophagus putrescentiae]
MCCLPEESSSSEVSKFLSKDDNNWGVGGADDNEVKKMLKAWQFSLVKPVMTTGGQRSQKWQHMDDVDDTTNKTQ